MQRDDFTSAIRMLWAELRLGEPRIVDPRHVRLRIEGMGIDLFDSGTGLLVVEGVAGRLSTDPVEASRQVRRVLETNVGLLIDGDAGVYLKASPAGAQALVATSAYRLSTMRIDRLVKKIEDTLRLVEYYAPEFKGLEKSAPGSRVAMHPSAEPVVIFRP
ncbi:MAG: hypothetical protein H7Y08_07540 [Rhizobiaceae bacterium]|nr:hypothetical protein [Rhizobiaceae bacterium]